MSRKHRFFREGFPHHTYTRGRNGNVLFYSKADCIYFLTLYFCLARKYGITVLAFCEMPNHFHSSEQAPRRQTFLLFHGLLNSEFAREYNNEHSRSGPLFDTPFGYAAKAAGKKIRDNLCYIANNPVVGNLCKDILDFRWNLLAYRESDHPFSEEIVLRRATRAMKRALAKVKYFREKDLPLTYARQRTVMKGLDEKERQQILDFIISRYNGLNYVAMESFYQDSFQQACLSFRANSGSEHDIPEDYEDYRNYTKMIRLMEKLGIDLTQKYCEALDIATVHKLTRRFQSYGFPARQIRRLLHLEE